MRITDSMIVRHWRQLDGAVHPLDRPVFDSVEHTFNLDWPPPAYLGDIIDAPFVLLMLNGGYGAETDREFSNPGAVRRYLEHLHNPGPIDPAVVAPYYARRNYASSIEQGRLALVNAIPYRSPKFSEEPQNERVIKLLPSYELHQRWLLEELVPQALAGTRTVIAHRNGKWRLKRRDIDHPNIVFTTSAISPDLPKTVLDVIAAHP